MSQLKPKISNQLNIEVINDACDKNYQAVMLKYYQLQFGWFHNAYNSFQDIDKYVTELIAQLSILIVAYIVFYPIVYIVLILL